TTLIRSDALPGVNSMVKGTQRGVISNTTGEYEIEVPDRNATLVFSFVGYLTQEVVVGSRTTIDVSMVIDEKSLEEVVVVGYGTQKKATLTGARSAVSGDITAATPVTHVSHS